MGKRIYTTCIYALISPDKKVYVGQTTDLINRRSRYKTLTCQNQRRVYESLLQHGYDAHKFIILMEFEKGLGKGQTRNMLDFHEELYLKLYERAGYGIMNLKSAGWNGKPCEETIELLRKSHIGQAAWNKGLRGAQPAWNKGLTKKEYANR